MAGWGETPPAAIGEQLFVLPPAAGLFLLAAVRKLLLSNSAHVILVYGSGTSSTFSTDTHFY